VNVALSAILLVGSGLLVRSFLRLLTVAPGFDPHGVLTMQMNLSGQAYADHPGITRFYDELTMRLQALPGVVGVSASTVLPLTDNIDRSGITIEDKPLANPAEAPDADRFGVRPDYFETMKIPLLRGRFLDETDSRGAAPAAVIGETMAKNLWRGEDPIGRRIRVAGGPHQSDAYHRWHSRRRAPLRPAHAGDQSGLGAAFTGALPRADDGGSGEGRRRRPAGHCRCRSRTRARDRSAAAGDGHADLRRHHG
jgi:hypothetical protein